jgi:DNA-binding NarL/FixJ family response regulator
MTSPDANPRVDDISESGQKAPVRILVVDDSHFGREAVRELLEIQGHVVVGEVADGASAIAAARDLRPEAILVDVALADEDGLVVARRLVAERPDVPVVLMSVDPVSRADVAASGARGFVIKQDLPNVELVQLIQD